MDQQALDRKIADLRASAKRWSELPLARRIEYLRQCIAGVVRVAPAQVNAALQAKGLAPRSALSGEEWLGGPMVTVRNLRLLAETLENFARGEDKRLGQAKSVGQRQVAVDVFPCRPFDRLLFRGFSAQVWMEPQVARGEDVPRCAFYRQGGGTPSVALVLGAGNVASIGPLDVIYKMFAEGSVCLLKLNPVNDYLGPYIEQAFACLVADGYLDLAYGGADVGAYLCQHEGIDQIHITGSDKTHDAIVYGVGPEGNRRKGQDQPVCNKRITSELGNVSPVVVMPGRWQAAEIRFVAENIATQMMNNAGFNCNAAKVLVLPRQWPQREALLDSLRAVLKALPLRRAYYPGAQERYDRFMAAHPDAEPLATRTDEALPPTLIRVDAAQSDDICFTTESFCCITAVTEIDGADPGEFLRRSVDFCNHTLWGTLNACVFVDPKTERKYPEAVDAAVANLNYGSVVLNHWPAVAYGLGSTTWGAFPGHCRQDIQSGVGVVHNTFLFDRPQKSVLRGPFRVSPKPPWFVTHRRMDRVAQALLELEATQRYSDLPSVLFNAVLA